MKRVLECPPQTFPDNIKFICQKCHYSCDTCIGNGEKNCTSCDNETRALASNVKVGTCFCQQNFYIVENEQKCSSKLIKIKQIKLFKILKKNVV